MKTILILIAVLVLQTSTVNAQPLATIPIMADRNNEPHDYSFGPTAVPLGVTFARFVFDTRDNLRGDGTLTVVNELSLNGGITWQPAGGGVFNALSQPADFVAVLSEPSNAGRIVRGRITLYGDRWRGGAFVELEE